MRVTYRGIENGYHIMEWLPTDKPFPPIRLYYANCGGAIEITPGNYSMTMVEAVALAYALNAAALFLVLLKEREEEAGAAGVEQDVREICCFAVDDQNKTYYDFGGGRLNGG